MVYIQKIFKKGKKNQNSDALHIEVLVSLKKNKRLWIWASWLTSAILRCQWLIFDFFFLRVSLLFQSSSPLTVEIIWSWDTFQKLQLSTC